MLELARTYSLVGNEARVEQFFLRCVELNPRRAALYHCQIGWHFQRKKRWARALSWYDRALETFQAYHLCLFRKGYCLERLHRPRAAVDAFKSADESYSASPPEQQERGRGIQIQVLFHLARNLREVGETERARAALDRCAHLDDRPGERVIRSEHRLASYGETYLRDENHQAAIRCLEEARGLDAGSSVIWERLGRAYERSDRLEDAEAALRRSTELPKGEVALVALGSFLRRAGRVTEAAQVLASALERHPRGEVQIRMEFAELQIALNRPRSALEELERLAGGRVPPGSTLAAAVESRIAEVLIQHGQLSRALPYLRSAAEQEAAGEVERARLDALLARIESPQGQPTATESVVDEPLPDELARVLGRERPRVEGRVASYFADRGFGFIAHGDGGETIFFHVSHCEIRDGEALAAGNEVSFVVGLNQRNRRPQAEKVRLRAAAQ
ncbi:MAG: tetratricopeptide repeat protein [Candidatus Binatia bacterium]|nr:tetratricopeptide repeat protein [Candidatus Binatia bacterium]